MCVTAKRLSFHNTARGFANRSTVNREKNKKNTNIEKESTNRRNLRARPKIIKKRTQNL
jgi:hypothetical protein